MLGFYPFSKGLSRTFGGLGIVNRNHYTILTLPLSAVQTIVRTSNEAVLRLIVRFKLDASETGGKALGL